MCVEAWRDAQNNSKSNLMETLLLVMKACYYISGGEALALHWWISLLPFALVPASNQMTEKGKHTIN